MELILGIPKSQCQGTPNSASVRLAYMDTWHKRLETARMHRGVSKSDVASAVKVSNATVSDWESGKTKKIEGDNLLNVCEYLRISAKWLLFNKGPMEDEHLSEEDLKAIGISRQITTARDRAAWYRAGSSYAEPDEGTNGKQ